MGLSEINNFDGFEDKDRKFDILEGITRSDGGDKYRNNAMKYCMDDRCVARKGYGIDNYDPQIAAMQFKKNAEFWGNEDNNPMIQYMLSKLKDTAPTPEDAMRFTEKIMEPVTKEHLALTVAHIEERGDSKNHTHTFVESTNFNDGSMLNSDNTTNYGMAQRTANVLKKPVKLVVEYKEGEKWTCPKIFIFPESVGFCKGLFCVEAN